MDTATVAQAVTYTVHRAREVDGTRVAPVAINGVDTTYGIARIAGSGGPYYYIHHAASVAYDCPEYFSYCGTTQRAAVEQLVARWLSGDVVPYA